MAMPDIRQSVAPAANPVSLSEAKLHLRVDSDTEDSLIEGLISAATKHIDGKEGLIFRCLMPQKWLMYLDRFPACGDIVMPLGPVTGIDGISYIDADGSPQTIDPANYELAIADGLDSTVLSPAYGTAWPAARCQARAVTITYSAGYANAAAVPAPIRQAILLMVGHWYANREASVIGASVADLPLAVEALLYPYKRLYV